MLTHTLDLLKYLVELSTFEEALKMKFVEMDSSSDKLYKMSKIVKIGVQSYKLWAF